MILSQLELLDVVLEGEVQVLDVLLQLGLLYFEPLDALLETGVKLRATWDWAICSQFPPAVVERAWVRKPGFELEVFGLEVGQDWSEVRRGLAAEHGSRRVPEKVVVEVDFRASGGLG